MKEKGNRVSKNDGTVQTNYIQGADGKSEAVRTSTQTNPTYNIWGGELIGQVRRSGAGLRRYYYLKDHLGSNRVTVQGGDVIQADDFSGTLSQWTTPPGCTGFYICFQAYANQINL